MNLLLVAATELEIKPFLEENINLDVLLTGVGIPATVFHLTKKLIERKYDLVIQAGIAGAFNDQLNSGDVVAVRADTFADAGIEEYEKLHSLFDYGFLDKNEFPYTDGWLVNNNLLVETTKLPDVKGITVSKIGDNHLQNQLVKEKFSPGIESMEGAAFHYVCLQQKINFLQIRSISNQAGERNKDKWQIKKAILNLNKELSRIIKDYQ